LGDRGMGIRPKLRKQSSDLRAGLFRHAVHDALHKTHLYL